MTHLMDSKAKFQDIREQSLKSMTLDIDGIRVSRTLTYEELLASMEERAADEARDEEERSLLTKNAAIMKRSDEKLRSDPKLEGSSGNGDLKPRQWVVITDPKCPDSARNIPIIRTMAERSPRIELSFVLKEENPELMERFRTEGKEAVPKLLETTSGEGKVQGTWGPRPTPLHEKVKEWKDEEPDIEKGELQRRIQKWYAQDKGRTAQEELHALLERKEKSS